jgi:hypothetical protein
MVNQSGNDAASTLVGTIENSFCHCAATYLRESLMAWYHLDFRERDWRFQRLAKIHRYQLSTRKTKQGA